MSEFHSRRPRDHRHRLFTRRPKRPIIVSPVLVEGEILVHFAGRWGSVVGLSVASAQKFGDAPFGEHASLLSKAKLGAQKARSLKSSVRARSAISGCWHDRSRQGRATSSRSAMAAGRRRARHARLPWLSLFGQ